MLSAEDKDPEEAVFFGCHFKVNVPQGYMSGGAGYILSRSEAVLPISQ